MTEEILFQTTELLADPSNPSHACCSECGNVKPIGSFRRRATALQAKVWGWDKQRDRKDRTYTAKDCNACALKKRRARKYTDYVQYDKLLRLTGRYEFEVPHPDKKTKNGEPVYITERERMVLAKKKRGKDAQKEGGRKGIRQRYATHYADLKKQVVRELDRTYKQIKVGSRIPECAKPYLTAYTTVLRAIKHDINLAYEEGKHPKATPNDYINATSITTKQTRELFRNLSGEHKELVAKKFL